MAKESHVVRVDEDFRLTYRVWERLEDGSRSAPSIQSAEFALYPAGKEDDEEELVVSGAADVDGNEVSFLLTQANGGSATVGLYEGRFTADFGEETRKHYCLVEVRRW